MPVDFMQASMKQDSAASCFRTYPDSDMMRWKLDRAEDVYHSSAREPLGKAWVRGHTLPAGLGTEVPFGRKVDAKQNSAVSMARQAIAPVDADFDVRCASHAEHEVTIGCAVTAAPRSKQHCIVAIRSKLMGVRTTFVCAVTDELRTCVAGKR